MSSAADRPGLEYRGWFRFFNVATLAGLGAHCGWVFEIMARPYLPFGKNYCIAIVRRRRP